MPLLLIFRVVFRCLLLIRDVMHHLGILDVYPPPPPPCRTTTPSLPLKILVPAVLTPPPPYQILQNVVSLIKISTMVDRAPPKTSEDATLLVTVLLLIIKLFLLPLPLLLLT